MKQTLLACVITLILTISIPAQSYSYPEEQEQTANPVSEIPIRTHDIVPEDYFAIGVINSCAVSPSGQQVAYTEGRWDEDLDGRNLDLWVVDIDTKQRRRLTFDKAADRSPVWSPDGQFIYFLSNRSLSGEKKPPLNGKTQIWRISPDGGQPQAVTRVENGIDLYVLSHDGKSIYYVTSDDQVTGDFKELKEKYSDLDYGDDADKCSVIWKLDLEGWWAKKIVDEKRYIRDLAITEDESRIAMVTAPDNSLIKNEGWTRIDVFDAETEKVEILTPDGWREDHPSPYGWVEEPAWARDGKALAFSISFDGYNSELYVIEWIEDMPELRKLDRGDQVDVSGGLGLKWRGETRELCFIGEWHACRRVYGIPSIQDGQEDDPRILTPGDIVVDCFDFDPSGRILTAALSTTTHPPDLYMYKRIFSAGAEPEIERITNVNPQVDTWKLPMINIVQWKALDGTECEGILELPPDYDPADGPLPMIVELHGGPTASTLYRFRLWIYGRAMMPARGYALFSPNYRGSTGYGDNFVSGLVGKENDIEVRDILSGVDMLVEEGIADPNRLGVMGWSNGGYLTNCLITQTGRFKAASSGAGILDMIIQWGSEDTPGHVVNFQEGLVWETPDAYRKASPIYNLHKIRTPTLIHVGGGDERCPRAHSTGLYRALKHYLDVPTELVIYPGEGHGLTKYKNRLAKMKWDIAWFDKYLLEKDKKEKEDEQPSEDQDNLESDPDSEKASQYQQSRTGKDPRGAEKQRSRRIQKTRRW